MTITKNTIKYEKEVLLDAGCYPYLQPDDDGVQFMFR